MAMRKRFSVAMSLNVDASALIRQLLAETAAFAAEAKLAPRDRERLAIVIEELASNAARHGAGEGGLQMAVTLSEQPEGIEITIDDDGAPFDPTARRLFSGPDPQTGGGVGLALVQAWCDPIVYLRDGQTNRLELRLARAR